MKINIPPDARNIINVLNNNGYEAFVVGGCVRDAILGKEPEDWDITTSALPEQVKALFRRTIDTGLKHGTVTVMCDKTGYEITTYRIDGEYRDGRHPENVEFTVSLYEDLRRRDFTINAMAYNDERGIVDEFDGLGDLKKGIIKCVGEAMERFEEDSLRMMRAIRFSAQLNFEIEDKTGLAIKEHSKHISLVSAERIRVELVKTLLSQRPGFIFLLCDYGMADLVLPVLCEHRGCGRENLVSRMLSLVPERTALRFSVLFAFDGEETAVKAMRALRFDNRTVSMVGKLVRFLHEDLKEDEVSVRQMLCKCKTDIFFELLELKKAYVLAKGENADILDRIRTIADRILERGDAYELSMLKITGTDLLDMGVERGSKVGEVLAMLLDEVIREPEKNDTAILKAMVRMQMGEKQ